MVWGGLLLSAGPAWALRRDGKATWSITTRVGPDAQVPGWFINLGLTGARAKIPEEAPNVLEVTYVFPGTPAAGRLKVGDRIVGANGRPFPPHKFGYGMDVFGYEGPMMSLGLALEESQMPRFGGRLRLAVVRDGRPVAILLHLPTTYGAYARTYPFRCHKTDRVLAELYAYLLRRQRPDGLWHGRPHINAFAAMALMGSPRSAHRLAARRAVQAMAKQTERTVRWAGLDCWKYTLYGIAMAEYYLLTGEAWLRPELEEVRDWLTAAQAPNGGWCHRPWNPERGNGYGPFNAVTMQAKLALALMWRAGLAVNARRFAAAHEFVVRGTNAEGYVWYADGGARKAGYADMGRTGIAVLAHALSPVGGLEYRLYARRGARCIGNHPQTFPDTHGCPLLGMVWTALGAATDPVAFRRLMDYNRWWFSLAHCPDGTFYYQPNRDNNPQDYTAAPRLSASAATALIFSLRYHRLQVTGARPVMRTAGTGAPAPSSPARLRRAG